MSKKLHLICNAHIDPVWQWEWEEGAAETLSTFRIAVNFCKEYDNFVFCHNEALLYQWIEEYDMPLFEEIKALVAAGKWHIMGGWQLQPDCNMPSGEGFVRQIFMGRKYFMEKFGVAPRVGVNVDPFGHSRGLVQILTKSGYDGYLFMRPDQGDRFIKLPANEFRWVGYDGSEVTAVRMTGGYNSPKGKAAAKIKDYIGLCPEDDFFLCLWGIGNHGGGPSKKDLDDIAALSAEVAKDGVTLVHSTPEMYIDEANAKHTLPKYDKSLNPWAVGCYTSQVRIKQKYRQAENMLFFAESICSHAASCGLIEYPEKEIAESIYDILLVQFHDILPGTSVQPAEESALRTLDHALEILSRIKARAFFALAAGQKKAPEDKIPVFIYNPYPYPVSGDFVGEFMLWDQHWEPDFLHPVVYDQNGVQVAAQCEKENSTIPLEWRKRVTFHAELEPMSMNRFECGFRSIPAKPVPTLAHNDTHYIFDTEGLHVKINRLTGLVDFYAPDESGKSLTADGAFGLEIFEDNYDPWYMETNSFPNKLDEFRLLTPEEAAEYCHTDAALPAVHVIESGDVRTIVEAVFGYKSSRARVKYILSKKDGFKVDIRLNWNEKQRMVKWNVPAAFEGTYECLGEHAYGREVLCDDTTENVSQNYLALCGAEKALAVINNGVYGSSFYGKNGVTKITLLRSPSYTAHPLDGRITMPQDRYMPYIDQGERDYSFLVFGGEREKVLDHAAREALHFNRPPMVLSFYPTGIGEKPQSPVRLADNTVVTVNAYKKAEVGDGYILRVFNPTEKPQTATLEVLGTALTLDFGKYEIKSVRFSDGKLSECTLMEDLI